jgi:hypothetical protein
VSDGLIAIAGAALLGLDVVYGGSMEPRGRRSALAYALHPITTARRSLHRWSYRRHLRRTGSGATRARVWEPKAGVRPARINAQVDLYHAAFEEYARGVGTASGLPAGDELGIYYIDNLSGLQRAALDRAINDWADIERATREWRTHTGVHLDHWRSAFD